MRTKLLLILLTACTLKAEVHKELKSKTICLGNMGDIPVYFEGDDIDRACIDNVLYYVKVESSLISLSYNPTTDKPYFCKVVETKRVRKIVHSRCYHTMTIVSNPKELKDYSYLYKAVEDGN